MFLLTKNEPKLTNSDNLRNECAAKIQTTLQLPLNSEVM